MSRTCARCQTTTSDFTPTKTICRPCRATQARRRQPVTPFDPSRKGKKYGTDDIGYDQAHYRVAKARGRAADYLCDCGLQAEQWAYIHGSPKERRYATGYAHSPDPNDYHPMCVQCHSRYDSYVRSMEQT